MLTVLDLFSGIGGFSLGLEMAGGFRTVAFCENDSYARQVLAKHWPDVPQYDDVRTLNADGYRGVDCIVGGPPCQPWSQAGKQRGVEDDRDLWPEMHRVIAAARPTWAVIENVRGFVSQPMGLDRCISDLEASGYAVQAFVIPAVGVDAPHRRERVFVVAHAEHDGRHGAPLTGGNEKTPFWAKAGGTKTTGKPTGVGTSRPVADAISAGQSHGKGRQTSARCNRSGTADNTGCRSRGGAVWLPESDVCRVAHGVPSRVDRLRCLGNAVVPQVVAAIGRAILKAEA